MPTSVDEMRRSNPPYVRARMAREGWGSRLVPAPLLLPLGMAYAELPAGRVGKRTDIALNQTNRAS
jgi:hypothetical protein